MIIATILVALITFAWMVWFAPEPPEEEDELAEAETEQVEEPPEEEAPDEPEEPTDPDPDDLDREDEDDIEEAPGTEDFDVPPDPALDEVREGDDRTIVIDHDLYTAHFSTRGATITSFELKEYLNYDREGPVQFVGENSTGALSVAFTTPDSYLADTRSFFFDLDDVEDDTLHVEDESLTLTFDAPLGDGNLRKEYTFEPGSYGVDFELDHENASTYLTRDGYELVWSGGMPFSEGGTDMEKQRTGVLTRTGGSLERITADSEEFEEMRVRGRISWLGMKNQYFTKVAMPTDMDRSNAAELIADPAIDQGGPNAPDLFFTGRLLMDPPEGDRHVDTFDLYVGPLDTRHITAYDRGLYDMVDYGWAAFAWMTRPIAEWFIIPAFHLLETFIANYGLIIILLAIFIKILVYPLTKSAYRSMAEMRELQPKMQEIKEEYQDEPEKQQQAMMELYKEAGVNPIGGCLPMFLQFPIIIALYQFLPQAIEVRQQSFLWAPDLSVPDPILHLPFEIPFYGDYVAGFTVLMGIAMAIQMRIQVNPGTGGQAKMFMYALPFFIFFIFNRFASALSLYYLFYNITTAIQQKWIYYQLDQEKEEEDEQGGRFSKKNGQQDDEESKGWFARLLEKAQEAQKEAQRRAEQQR